MSSGRRKSPPRKPGQLPRGRHGLPRHFVVHSQRERLLTGMAQAVSTKGYLALTVSDIHEYAGVSRKTFYEHFRDMEECFLAAFDVAVERMVSVVSAAYGRETDWRDRIRAGMQTFLQALASEPEFARMCVVEVMGAGPRAMARRSQAFKVFELFFEDGPAAATTDTTGGLIAEATVGGLAALLYERILRGETAELPRMRPEFMYWIVLPYLGADEARRELTDFRDWQPSRRPRPVDPALALTGDVDAS